MLPFADIFGDDLNPPTKGKLAQPHDSSSHHDLVSRGLNGPWIRAEEPDEARPKGGCRSHLVTFPALIMFTQSVQTFSGLSLGQFQDQPARTQVLTQGYRSDFEPFLHEFSQPDRRSGGPEGEVAKWQSRMTRSSSETEACAAEGGQTGPMDGGGWVALHERFDPCHQAGAQAEPGHFEAMMPGQSKDRA